MNSELMFAIIKDDYEKVRALLEKGIVKAEDKNMDLIAAAFFDRKKIVELLLENGVCVDAVDKKGNTALIAAAIQGHGEMAELLLKKYNADITVQNNNGDTALFLARFFRKNNTERLLREAEKDQVESGRE